MDSRGQQLALATALACGFATFASAQSFTFQKIISNDTGSQYQVKYPWSHASLSGTRIAFPAGVTNSSSRLMESIDGGPPATVYTQQTPVPGRNGRFAGGFPEAVNNGEHIFFGAYTNYSNHHGLYHRQNGQLGIVADDQTPAPNGGMFMDVAHVAGDAFHAENGVVSFLANTTAAPRALYQWDAGTISMLASTSTPVPGGAGTFQSTSFTEVWRTNGKTYFRGRDGAGKFGIYRADSSGVTVAFDTHMDAPPGYGKFTDFSQDHYAADGDDVLFDARTQSGSPYPVSFTFLNGQLSVLGKSGDPLPGGDTFSGVYHPCLQDGVFVFEGGSQQGVYTNFGGSIQLVAKAGSIIDGKTVLEALITRNSYDRGRLVMEINFVGHDPDHGVYNSALYLVSLPSPPSLSLLGACGTWACRRRR